MSSQSQGTETVEQPWAPPTPPNVAEGIASAPGAPTQGAFPPPEAPHADHYAPAGHVQAPAPQLPAPAGNGTPYGVIYCRGCGNPVNPQAAMCVNCGVPTGINSPPLYPANPKVKSTGVVLVVLFGVFGWLYTYKRDAWKFWLNLGLAVVTLGIWGLVAWIWAIIDMAVRPSEWYEAFPNGR